MTPLLKRLAEAPWAAEWPAGAVFGEATQWPSSWMPNHYDWAWSSAQKVVRAVGGEGEPISLEKAHHLLNQLEEWTVRYRALLTWPATSLGFARALVHSISVGDEMAPVIVAAYPAFCKRILEEARALDPKIPEFVSLFGIRGYYKYVREDAPSPPVAEPAPKESTPDISVASAAVTSEEMSLSPSDPAVAVEAAPLSPPKDSRPSRTPPNPVVPVLPSPLLVAWLSRLDDFSEPVLARQFVDQKIKENVQAYKGSPWKWFDQVLFPALLTLPEKDLSKLLDNWPTHNKFKPDPTDNPSSLMEWFNQNRLWAAWRDAGQERQAIMATHGMKAILDSSAIPSEEMPVFFSQITMFVKRNSRGFKQRLQLWTSLGGDLDASLPTSPLLESENVETVRAWVLAQKNPEWSSVLESYAPAAPASRFTRAPGM